MKNNNVGAEKSSSSRDINIDFLRGMFILMIAIDHFGWLVKRAVAPTTVHFPFVTWTHIGWSSAAEFFVFFSGYVIGLVYVKTLQAKGFAVLTARSVHRAWQLYCYNLITWAVAGLILSIFWGSASHILALTQFDQAQKKLGFDALVQFASLQGGPAFFDILQMYIVFLICTPFLLVISKVSTLALGVLSVFIWCISQIYPEWTLYRSGSAWGFNPLSWQLVFCFGLIAAKLKFFDFLNSRSRRVLVVLTGMPLCIIFFLKLLQFVGWTPGWIDLFDAGLDKRTLGFLRVLHFACSLVFLFSILPRGNALVDWVITRGIARIGKFSLEAFCFSTLVCYVASAYILTIDNTRMWVMGSVGIAIIFSMMLFVFFIEWLKGVPWRN